MSKCPYCGCEKMDGNVCAQCRAGRPEEPNEQPVKAEKTKKKEKE